MQTTGSAAHGRQVKIRLALLTAGLVLLGPFAGAASARTTASFAQLEGRDGCVRALGSLSYDQFGETLTRCSTASGRGDPKALVLGRDEKHLPVAAGGGDDGSNAIVVLDRDGEKGALSHVSCTSNDGGDGRLGSDGACTDGDGLSGLSAIAITPGGGTVFATSRTTSSLAWFTRDATGKPDAGRLPGEPRLARRAPHHRAAARPNPRLSGKIR